MRTPQTSTYITDNNTHTHNTHTALTKTSKHPFIHTHTNTHAYTTYCSNSNGDLLVQTNIPVKEKNAAQVIATERIDNDLATSAMSSKERTQACILRQSTLSCYINDHTQNVFLLFSLYFLQDFQNKQQQILTHSPFVLFKH